VMGQNISRRYRDEEAYPIRHPALKYRAKVTPPLRGEEQPCSQFYARGIAAGGLPGTKSTGLNSKRRYATSGGAAAGELSRRAPPVSQRLTALRAAEPREGVESNPFTAPETHRTAGGGAARRY